MPAVVRVVLIAGIVVYVLVRQLRGEPLRAKRMLVLPAVLAVLGVRELARGGPLSSGDLTCLVLGVATSLGIGVMQGRALRLEERDGALWGRLPVRGLLWWAALVGSHVALAGLAAALGASAAESGSAVFLLIGMNRFGQAAVVLLHGWRTGVPFAPEPEAGLRERLGALRTPSYDPAPGRRG